MKVDELLSSEFIVRWDDELQSLLVVHPDRARFPQPHVQIRSSTLEPMSWQQASQFIGERLVLLIPALRARYVNAETGMLPTDSGT